MLAEARTAGRIAGERTHSIACDASVCRDAAAGRAEAGWVSGARSGVGEESVTSELGLVFQHDPGGFLDDVVL